ncbi:MAG: hypothetical protein VX071_07690, partial [Candidatus Thermoplasmatota archaeon]|nr:hypothetical protein [Candidatus Thermoplasmatota archaeon]
MSLSIQAVAQKRNFTLPTPEYNSNNESFVCYPYYSPVGYLTLYVLKRTRRQVNDDPEQELTILQHADVYDEHSRATTSCLQACFPTATVHSITLPREQASDFALLASYAAVTTKPAYILPNELLSRLRDNAVAYTNYLEQTAATAHNEHLQHLLNNNEKLQEARDGFYAPIFTDTPIQSNASRNSPNNKRSSSPPSANASSQAPPMPATQQAKTSNLSARAAEQRAAQANARGIGDTEAVRKRHKEAEQQARDGTDNVFGASRASALRQRLHETGAPASETVLEEPMIQDCLTQDAYPETETVVEVDLDPRPPTPADTEQKSRASNDKAEFQEQPPQEIPSHPQEP